MSVPKIILYYAFAPLSDPQAVALWQRELADSLGLRGRIIVSKHGINGTLGGEIAACKQYLKRTRQYEPFRNLSKDTKWSDAAGYAPDQAKMNDGRDRRAPWRQVADFPKLSVKVRDELVAFGAPEEVKVGGEGVIGGGEHLSPEAVNKLVDARGDDVVFFDGRNAYEAGLGKFRGAVVPDVSTTHGFVEQLESGLYDHLKDRPIVTYCTGGIRCEILTVLMKNRGFSEVYQIDGGIVRYGEKFGNAGLWDGSLVVFDGRETVDFTGEKVAVGKCSQCDRPAAFLANCEDANCRERLVVCELHRVPAHTGH